MDAIFFPFLGRSFGRFAGTLVLAVMGLFGVSENVHAARTIDAVTLNNASSVSVTPGDFVTLVIDVTTTGSGSANDWRSTGWLISATPPGTLTCWNHGNATSAGSYSANTTIQVPMTPGTYNAYFVAYDDDGCSTGASSIKVLSNGVIVVATPPTVTTNAASALSVSGATLNGTVSSNGTSTAVTFDYGLTTSYGSTATATASPLAAGAVGAAVSVAVTGLTCSTTYHYRAKGVNLGGTTLGADATFTTVACPTPTVVSVNTASTNPTITNSTVAWTVVFNTSVSGVDAADFALVPGGGVTGATIGTVSGSGTTWTVQANTGTATGTLGLNVVDNDSIVNGVSAPLGGVGALNGNFTGQVYTVNAPAPVLAKVASTSAAVVNDVVTFNITATNPFGADMNSVTVSDVLPTGMTYVTYAATAGTVANAGQNVTWTIPVLLAGGSAQLTLAVKVTLQGAITNTVTSVGSTSASASVLVLASAVTHYRMDGTAGSWAGVAGEVIDSGGTELHGTRVITTSPTSTNLINPTPTIAAQYPSVVGGFCNAASFDGNAVVQVLHDARFDYTTKLSASAWLYPTAYPASDLYSIFSNDVNYEFHLTPAGKLNWWWGASSFTSATTVPLNQWTHIAITMDSGATAGRERMYINGVLDANSNNWKGTLASNPCPFYIGGDIATGSPVGSSCNLRSDRNFRGRIDEVKLYNYELTAAEVQADMTLGRNCSGTYDHIQIEHDASASVCTPETVTIKACLNAACTTLFPGDVTIQLSPTGWVGGDTVVIHNGIGSASLSKATAGSVTLGTVSATPAAANSTRCFNGSSETCAMTFATASCLFDAVEPSAAPKTRLLTKMAGVAFNVDVLALTGSSVNTGYTGTVTTDLVDASSASCPSGAGLTTAQSLSFVLANAGRKPATFTYDGAAKNVRVRMAVGAGTPACSTDNFAIRPTSVTLTASPAQATPPSAIATPVAKAGAAFALNGSSTAGYTGTVTLDSSRLTAQPTAQDTVVASGGVVGTFNPASLAINASPALTGNASYNEVGYLYLAAGAFRDETFTAVDQPGGCLATGTCDCVTDSTSNNNLSTSLVGSTGRYGCYIGSTAASLGRFVPDHFDTSATGTLTCAATAGTVGVTNGSTAVTGAGTAFLSAIAPGNTIQIAGVEYLVSAVPSATSLTLATAYAGATASGLAVVSCPVGAMVYSGQAFSASVTAKNLAGTTTQNYMGKFAKDVNLKAAASRGGASIAVTAPGGTLTGTAAASSFTNGSNAASLAAPLFAFATAPTIPTSVFVRAEVPAPDSVTSLRSPATASVEGGVKVVSGRIKIPNAYGSERLALPMTATVQYYNAGSNWVTSATDSVSAFNSNLVSTGNVVASVVSGLGSGVTVLSPGTAAVVSGVRTFTLAAPMVSGNVDISLNAPIYLPSTTGRATFGIFRSPLIYRRENY